MQNYALTIDSIEVCNIPLVSTGVYVNRDTVLPFVSQVTWL